MAGEGEPESTFKEKLVGQPARTCKQCIPALASDDVEICLCRVEQHLLDSGLLYIPKYKADVVRQNDLPLRDEEGFESCSWLRRVIKGPYSWQSAHACMQVCDPNVHSRISIGMSCLHYMSTRAELRLRLKSAKPEAISSTRS